MAKKNGFRPFSELTKTKTHFRREEVYVEEWETKLYVRQLSGREQQVISDLGKGKKPEDYTIDDMAEILTMSLEDPDGGKLPIEWLVEQPFPVLVRLTRKTNEISGFTESATEALEKN